MIPEILLESHAENPDPFGNRSEITICGRLLGTVYRSNSIKNSSGSISSSSLAIRVRISAAER
jgi:hypothetical protein